MENSKQKKVRTLMPVARVFASQSTAFLASMLAVLVQLGHLFLLSKAISGFTGNGLIIHTTMVALILSMSLMFFTLESAKEKDLSLNKKWYKKMFSVVNLFWFFETISNIAYYTHSILMHDGEFIDSVSAGIWFTYSFSVIISVMIPTTIKLYAGKLNVFKPVATERIINKSLYDEFRLEMRKYITTRITNTDNDNIKKLVEDLITKYTSVPDSYSKQITFLSEQVAKYGDTNKNVELAIQESKDVNSIGELFDMITKISGKLNDVQNNTLKLSKTSDTQKFGDAKMYSESVNSLEEIKRGYIEKMTEMSKLITEKDNATQVSIDKLDELNKLISDLKLVGENAVPLNSPVKLKLKNANGDISEFEGFIVKTKGLGSIKK